jgi:hypothetical protein
VRNSFNIEDGTQGVAYATPYDEESAYFESAHAELDGAAYDEIEEAEEALQIKLDEYEIEILDYLMDDMPGTAKVIKKHMKRLKDKFDWTQFK